MKVAFPLSPVAVAIVMVYTLVSGTMHSFGVQLITTLRLLGIETYTLLVIMFIVTLIIRHLVPPSVA